MPNPNPSNFTMWDNITGQKDLDDEFITDDWLEEQFVGKSLFAWGGNSLGALGNGSISSYSSPIQIGSLTSWSQVATYSLNNKPSSEAFAAIKTDGSLWGCGYNGNGTLGQNNLTNVSSPVQVGALTNWKQVALSLSLAAVKTDGTLWTCGYNGSGQLGNSSTSNTSSPVQVGTLTNWKQVACGLCTAAVKQDGTLWVWGGNSSGQLGNSTITSYSSPIQVGILTNWKQVASSPSAIAAVKTDGTLWVCGSNASGLLCQPTSATAYSSPIQIGSLTNWKSVSVGYGHMIAIKTDGTMWAWGSNNKGQLGNSTITSYSSPIQIGALTNWKQVSCGYAMFTAVKTDGTLWSCGYNNNGQLGNGVHGTNYSSPIQVGSLTNWKQIACGYNPVHSITYAEIT